MAYGSMDELADVLTDVVLLSTALNELKVRHGFWLYRSTDTRWEMRMCVPKKYKPSSCVNMILNPYY